MQDSVTMGQAKPKRIRTQRLELKTIPQEDAPKVVGILTHEEVGKTYMVPQNPTEEVKKRLSESVCRLSAVVDRFVYGIYRENTLVGLMNDVEIRDGAIELGYAFHPEHWNQGYATEALQAAIDTLHRMGYHTVRTGAFPENLASIRVMEKAGMTRLKETEDVEYRGEIHRCVLFEKKA